MRLMLSVVAMLALPIAATAQDYPSRQVTIVVPFAAGGSVDIVGRLVAQKLTERLGKPFIVENRPGAGTATATTAVAKSPPDGHTLLFRRAAHSQSTRRSTNNSPTIRSRT